MLLGRTGDLCCILPFLKAEAEAGEKPNLIVSSQHVSVMDGVNYVNPVAFEGGIHLIREAFEFARKQFPDVKSLQVVGQADAVGEVTYRPAGQERAKMTSFVKEYWKLAGKMSLWDHCLPLVFDRRSPERERQLLERYDLVRSGRKKRLVLVAGRGHSSPFPFLNLLQHILSVELGSEFRIEQLPETERFYDLLALYERAHCLVSVDSAPLHLARACPSLPVMALVADHPIEWNGSAWQPNWHWTCRYHDFPFRAHELGKAIRTCRSDSPWPEIRLWSNVDGTWDPDSYHRNSLPVAPGMCVRNSMNSLKDTKKIPFLRDCLRLAIQRAGPGQNICLHRPHTIIIEPMPVSGKPAFSYRWENDGFVPIADLFSAPKAWWLERLADLPDYLLGNDHYWSEGLMVLFQKHQAQDITGICHRRKK